MRHELQEVHPIARGFVTAGSAEVSSGFVTAGSAEPSLKLERAAMIYFGVPAYAVHVNGWVRHPERPQDPRPWGMWVAQRSLSKATYAGLLDQMVAGGQPAGMSFADNVAKVRFR